MAVAFRAETLAGNTAAANITVTKPTGTVDGDILVVHIYREDTTAITYPGGWTEVAAITNTRTTPDFRHTMAWKRASGEGANYVFTFTSTWRAAQMLCYSGAIASGDPNDVTPSTNASTAAGTTMTATGITTATANSMLIGLWNHYSMAGPAAGSGMTARGQIGACFAQDLIQAGAGASGNKTATSTNSDEWTSILAALKEPASAATAPPPPSPAYAHLLGR